ncbi:MAG: hypothetical protein IJ808_09450 [Muribaculaceae bacterium]|nr:hypothetical protein [Muribaculaceae bacterium]
MKKLLVLAVVLANNCCWNESHIAAQSGDSATHMPAFSFNLLDSFQAAIKEGDLLFLAPMQSNAITAVTGHYDHVAIMHRIGGENGFLYALEAIGRGVTLTPIDSLICREQGKSALVPARVDGLDATASVRRALRYVGRPYDWLYQPTDSAIYCSELVQLSYVNSRGQAVFGTIPMSFHDASGQISPFWMEHYARYGLPVPEGAPGTNPTQLANDSHVTLLPTIALPTKVTH